MNIVQKYFKFLVTFALIPVKANFEDKTLSFSFLSVKFGIYNIIQIVGTVFQQIALALTIGYNIFWKHAFTYVENSTDTDTITLLGSVIMFYITISCLAIFYRDLGKRSLSTDEKLGLSQIVKVTEM